MFVTIRTRKVAGVGWDGLFRVPNLLGAYNCKKSSSPAPFSLQETSRQAAAAHFARFMDTAERKYKNRIMINDVFPEQNTSLYQNVY